MQRYFDERNVPRPPTPRWVGPHPQRLPPDPVQVRLALDQLSAMVKAAIALFKEPISSSERSLGWNDVRTHHVLDALISLSLEVATADMEGSPFLGVAFIHEVLFPNPNVPRHLESERGRMILSIWSFIGSVPH